MFGHEFERENVRHFVENMRETLWSRKTLEDGIPLLLITASFSVICGIGGLDEGYEILPGIMSVMMVVAVILYLIWTGRKGETYASRFVSMGLGATTISLHFLNLEVANSITERSGDIHASKIIGIYILFFVIIFGGTLYGIKKDWYRPRISKFQRAKQIKMIAPAAVLGATAGGLIFKRLTNDLGTYEKEKVMVYLGLMVAVAAIFGITNFLKAYYVKKYGFTDPYEDGWYKPKRRKLKEAENEESTQ